MHDDDGRAHDDDRGGGGYYYGVMVGVSFNHASRGGEQGEETGKDNNRFHIVDCSGLCGFHKPLFYYF
jgi:hypothetical protein